MGVGKSLVDIRKLARTKSRDVLAALRTWPDRAAWRRVGAVYLLFGVGAMALGYLTGFLKPGLPALNPGRIALLCAGLLLRPALVEEIIFRALLLPQRPQSMPGGRLLIVTAISVALFVMSHVLNGLFVHRAPVFTDPVFLILAGMLGAASAAAYLLSRSLWPPVALHWTVVVTWLLLFGGWDRVR